MSDYWLGVLTIPALLVGLALAFAVLVVVFSPPSWNETWCYVKDCDRRDHRSAHPYRPWWVWKISWRLHIRDDLHRRWRREKMVKTRPWGRWRVREDQP